MDIKELTSQINAAKARLEQVATSDLYSPEEKNRLTAKYEAEIIQLEDLREAAVPNTEVIDPKIITE